MSIIERLLPRSRSRASLSDLPSTARGGLGNLRPPSREYRASHDGPEDSSDTRGRDSTHISSCDPDVVRFTGRGGVGNIRSPSRDAIRGGEDRSPETSESPIRFELRGRGYDRELIAIIDNANDSDTGVYSYGRGGAGNKSGSSPKSKSRSRSREPVHAAGRGSLGNISHGGPLEKVTEELVTFGRGGTDNVSGSRPNSQSRSRFREPNNAAGRGGLGNTRHSGPLEKDMEKSHTFSRGDTVGVPYLMRSAGNQTGEDHHVRRLEPEKTDDNATTTEQRLTSIEGRLDGVHTQLKDLNARMENIERLLQKLVGAP